MQERAVTWVEMRAQGEPGAPAISREALLRCALDLLAAAGVAPLRATPFELAEEGRCLVELAAGGEGASGALEAARASLEDHVTFSPCDAAPSEAEDISPALAGFTTEAIDHTADEAFAVVARDRADLLAAAAEALGALIVRPAGVRARRALPVAAPAPEPGWADDDRLFAWLAEVLYVLDRERFALRRAVVFEDGDSGVRGALFGEPIDPSIHEVSGGIKAVTYHGMEITPTPDGLRAQVVIDV